MHDPIWIFRLHGDPAIQDEQDVEIAPWAPHGVLTPYVGVDSRLRPGVDEDPYYSDEHRPRHMPISPPTPSVELDGGDSILAVWTVVQVEWTQGQPVLLAGSSSGAHGSKALTEVFDAIQTDMYRNSDYYEDGVK